MKESLQTLKELVFLYCYLKTSQDQGDPVSLSLYENYRRKPAQIRSLFPSGDTLESLNDVRTWR